MAAELGHVAGRRHASDLGVARRAGRGRRHSRGRRDPEARRHDHRRRRAPGEPHRPDGGRQEVYRWKSIARGRRSCFRPWWRTGASSGSSERPLSSPPRGFAALGTHRPACRNPLAANDLRRGDFSRRLPHLWKDWHTSPPGRAVVVPPSGGKLSSAGSTEQGAGGRELKPDAQASHEPSAMSLLGRMNLFLIFCQPSLSFFLGRWCIPRRSRPTFFLLIFAHRAISVFPGPFRVF